MKVALFPIARYNVRNNAEKTKHDHNGTYLKNTRALYVN